MIGLSLSTCVQDILRGRVAESDVEKIITAVCPDKDNTMDMIIGAYMDFYWHSFPREEVLALLSRLTIEHPRLQDDKRFPIAAPRWVKNEADIKWSKDHA